MKVKFLTVSILIISVIAYSFVPTNNWRGIQNYLQQTDNVTQITSISTPVEIDYRNGRITTVSSTLAAMAKATFVVNYSATMDTTADVNSEIILTPKYNKISGSGVPFVWVKSQTDSSFTVGVVAMDSTLAGVIVINYSIVN